MSSHCPEKGPSSTRHQIHQSQRNLLSQLQPYRADSMARFFSILRGLITAYAALSASPRAAASCNSATGSQTAQGARPAILLS